ncbi:DUF6153 family protein [Microbacterium invictum]|uniref:Lysylphosphatidylglycerol synthetase-like protein (DUF2156 family) n=1 Tax=Microbacterium invictum TaxID=515415 RepID=A0AA40SQN9_9MICO|nr:MULTISPECIES: DUF6153 family protein [Microbacterium]MBB4140645.1 lysylphosphatidylglycerol synthetase-like protein (DUF2156 family) [Microbacterium invictum]
MLTIRSLQLSRFMLARLLMSCAAALAIIVGLLAMHTFAPPAAHSTSQSISSATLQADHSQVTTEATGAAAVCETDCRSGAPAPLPDHSGVMAFCVLALLAVVLLVGPTTALSIVRSPRISTAFLSLLSGAMAFARPPSLTALSISRT